MNTDAVALDASCVVKLFLDEPDSPAFRGWHTTLVQQDAALRAPYLLQYEIGRVIQREFNDLPEPRLAIMLEDVLAGIKLGLVRPALPFGYGTISYYDASYISFAAAEGLPLATYDRRMATAGRNAGVNVWDGPLIEASLDPRYRDWLEKQRHRKDSVGEIAGEISHDDCLEEDTYLSMRDHMNVHEPTPTFLDGMHKALQEFTRRHSNS